ncbi:hypothetical protein SUGI_1172580 [Cryptomeria japonica]|nr:hypothetical protein SUGI_1172580 [Cryptomeria japonica]
MATSETPAPDSSRLGPIISPALDKIIKNASWRKHSKLVQECKVVLEKLSATEPSVETQEQETENLTVSPIVDGPISFNLSDSETILKPLIVACESGNLKIAEPALDCIQKLIVHGHIRGEADTTGGPENCEDLL